MTIIKRTLTLAAVIAATIALAGCSSSASKLPAGLEPDPSETSTRTTAAQMEPVDAYLAAAENDWKAAMRSHFAANQDKIATCMTDAGFQYIPSTMPADPPAVEKNTEEWISQHGYGMSAEDQKAQELLDILDTPYGVENPEQTAYVAGLSEAEMNEYYSALLGEGSTYTEQGGCMADQPIDPRFTPAANRLAQDSFGYQAEAASAGETVAAKDDWAACMVEAGHDGLGEPADANAAVSALYHPNGSPGTVEEKEAVAEREAGRGEPELTDAERAEVRIQEIAMALDDFDCKVATNYIERVNGVLYALEDAWIATHSAELDDVIAGYREASK